MGQLVDTPGVDIKNENTKLYSNYTAFICYVYILNPRN